MSRTHSHRPTNASLEAIGQRIGALEGDLKAMRGVVTGMLRGVNTITKPMPSIPFKVDERTGGGGIEIKVSAEIPSNLGILRVQLIRQFDNQVQGAETTEQAIQRAREDVKVFVIEITDQERASGVVTRWIGPLNPNDNVEKNKYQLVRLIGKDKAEDSVVFNPMEDPFDTMPFDTLVVDTGGAKFFTISESGIAEGPSKPEPGLIVSNAVNLETQASDATVRFKVIFSATDPTKTAADLDIDTVTVVLRPFSDADDATGETDAPLRETVLITDRTKTFTFVDFILPLGRRYKWVRNVTSNSIGKPQRAEAASTVSFYAGGVEPKAGIPEIESFTISAVQRNNEHTVLTASIKQFANSPERPRAALLKRLIFTVTEPGQAAEIVEKIPLLDQEEVFVQGNTTTFKKKVQHRANLTGIKFDATIFGINYRASDPVLALVKRDAMPATGNSTLNAVPTATLVSTAPDDDTEKGSDAYADVSISLVSGLTFAAAGVDTVIVKVRKANSTPDDDPDNDNRVREDPFVIMDDEKENTSVIKRVRKLQTAVRYEIPRVIAVRSGANVRSAKLNIAFRAGQMAVDPAPVTIVGSAVPFGKRHALITITVTQPGTAVLLKNVEIHQSLTGGTAPTDFEEVRQIPLKARAEFQVAGQSATIKRKVPVTPGTTGIRYFLRLRAIGNLTKDSAQFVQAATSSEAPTALPSIPQANDIVLNSINGDVTMGHAKVTFRVFASWDRVSTFASVGADSAYAIIVDQNDFGNVERYRIGGPIDPNATFADLEATSFTAGKIYKWRRNVTQRNGVKAQSQIADVFFIAGGPIGTGGSPGLPELTNLSVTLSQVMDDAGKADSRHVEATLAFTQAALQSGTGSASVTSGSPIVSGSGSAFLSQLRVGYEITVSGQTNTIVSISSNTSLTVDQNFTISTGLGAYSFRPPVVLIKRVKPFIVRNGIPRPRPGDRILDEEDLQTAGAKSYTGTVSTPKKTNFSIRYRITAVGGNFRDVDSSGMQSANEKEFGDTGAPNISNTPFLRWRRQHLRGNFSLSNIAVGGSTAANNNLNTHVTNKILFYFSTAGSLYLWNPLTRQTQLSSLPIDPLNNPAQAAFFIDIAKQSNFSFNNKIPSEVVVQSPRQVQAVDAEAFEIDSDFVVYNLIKANGGSLFCACYVFNQFNDVLTGAQVGTAIGILIFREWDVFEAAF